MKYKNIIIGIIIASIIVGVVVVLLNVNKQQNIISNPNQNLTSGENVTNDVDPEVITPNNSNDTNNSNDVSYVLEPIIIVKFREESYADGVFVCFNENKVTCFPSKKDIEHQKPIALNENYYKTKFNTDALLDYDADTYIQEWDNVVNALDDGTINERIIDENPVIEKYNCQSIHSIENYKKYLGITSARTYEDEIKLLNYYIDNNLLDTECERLI